RFDLVVKRISEISGLRYTFDDDTVRVELDTPYQKRYKIDYLSYVRSTSRSVQNSVSVVSGEGADTGSSYSVTSSSEADFWSELDTTLAQVLEMTTPDLRSANDPQISTVAATSAAPVEGLATDGSAEGVSVQAPQATLSVDS